MTTERKIDSKKGGCSVLLFVIAIFILSIAIFGADKVFGFIIAIIIVVAIIAGLIANHEEAERERIESQRIRRAVEEEEARIRQKAGIPEVENPYQYRREIPSPTRVKSFSSPPRTRSGYSRPKSPKMREWLYRKQGAECRGCGRAFHLKSLEVDHVIAKSLGGNDHPENLQLLCSSCNRIKGNRGMDYLLERLRSRKHF
ncbi:MAG: HNH endonuclease [Betaproteobacteria bacterium AqS2]|uniref:HNH endonuclease n=1 Tax=Candidatus Amphirhobacter heronislandensis TaxID=1732024 RepID=A0A930XXD1_9GAMM|nr:HNH endonuclease [Betaproteobacteria bacterium AqS2]